MGDFDLVPDAINRHGRPLWGLKGGTCSERMPRDIVIRVDNCIHIRPVDEGDLPLLTSWRQQPHVRQWWGPPEVEPEVDKLRDGQVAMWLVVFKERPIAFIQDYLVSDWSPHHFDYLPPGSRGMDLYVGERGAIGRGLGTKIVRQHVEYLFAIGVPAVGIDPDPDNQRARRAFEKAGFETASGPLDTRWGRAVLMHQFR